MQWEEVPDAITHLVNKHAGTAVARAENANGGEFSICDPDYGVIHVKHATAFKPVGRAYDWAGSLVGGPNPLTRTLTGATLGAMLGYGSGRLGGALLPDKYIDEEATGRRWGVLGGLLGGLGAGYTFGRPAMAQHGWQGLLKRSDVNAADYQEALKFASSTGAFAPRIPVDSWNRTVWARPEIPSDVKAMSTGLVSAASNAHGGARLVSPFDVGRIAIGMGSGAVSGMLVGKTLGALAGLTPPAQDAIFRTGVGAGLLTNVVPMVFPR